jgi:hypothetical protein
MAADRPIVLCVASSYTGDRFLVRCKREGCRVLLLTAEPLLCEPWPRAAIDEVFALPHFQDRRAVVTAVAYLARTRPIRRAVALNDFDVELVAHLREHLRLPGLTESAARLFRDKLAMRAKARELGVRIPEFVGVINYDEVRHFLAAVPGPWLLKPRFQASAVGIQTLHHADDVWRAIDRLGDDQSFHLLERLVPGDLYHVESLVAGGRVAFTEVNRYERPPLDVYQGGGVYATRTVPRDRPEVAALRHVNERVLAGFGLGRGASHTEFMKAHADGDLYFIETSARLGGAHTAEMVEAATGVDLWGEWARLEAAPEEPYEPPPLKSRYAGVVLAPARSGRPDPAPFTDPEIVHRLDTKRHAGFVVAADTPGRVEELLTDYADRLRRDGPTGRPPGATAPA